MQAIGNIAISLSELFPGHNYTCSHLNSDNLTARVISGNIIAIPALFTVIKSMPELFPGVELQFTTAGGCFRDEITISGGTI